eukprot:7150512-Pyramimonas_sp.AAC.1
MIQLSFDTLTDPPWGHHREYGGAQHVRTTSTCTPHHATETPRILGGTTNRITTGNAQAAKRT